MRYIVLETPKSKPLRMFSFKSASYSCSHSPKPPKCPVQGDLIRVNLAAGKVGPAHPIPSHFCHLETGFRVMEVPPGAFLEERMGEVTALHLQLFVLSTFQFPFNGEENILLSLKFAFDCLFFSLKISSK